MFGKHVEDSHIGGAFRYFCIIVFFSLPLSGFGQQQEMLSHTKVHFTPPTGFIVSDSTEMFAALKDVVLSTSFTRLISTDKKIYIYTTIIPYDTAGTDFIRRHFNPLYDRKDNYKNLIKCKIDSANGKVSYFKGNKLKKYNATVAGIYKMRLDFHFHQIYKNAKVLFMTKEETGDVELIYFYLDGADIDKYIRDTALSFTFK
jgi:hypothetical protein